MTIYFLGSWSKPSAGYNLQSFALRATWKTCRRHLPQDGPFYSSERKDFQTSGRLHRLMRLMVHVIGKSTICSLSVVLFGCFYCYLRHSLWFCPFSVGLFGHFYRCLLYFWLANWLQKQANCVDLTVDRLVVDRDGRICWRIDTLVVFAILL